MYHQHAFVSVPVSNLQQLHLNRRLNHCPSLVDSFWFIYFFIIINNSDIKVDIEFWIIQLYFLSLLSAYI